MSVVVYYTICVAIALFIVEHVLRTRFPNVPRIATSLSWIAKTLRRLFWSIGSLIAKLSDIIQWIKQFWRFIRWLIPFEEFWLTLCSVCVPLVQLVSSPFWILVGYAETLKEYISHHHWGATIVITLLIIATATYAVYERDIVSHYIISQYELLSKNMMSLIYHS